MIWTQISVQAVRDITGYEKRCQEISEPEQTEGNTIQPELEEDNNEHDEHEEEEKDLKNGLNNHQAY